MRLVGGWIKKSCKVIKAEVALSSLDSRPGEEPHHFVEEAVPAVANSVSLGKLFEADLGESADVVGVLRFVAPSSCKRPKVMRAAVVCEGVFKRDGVELSREMPNATGGEGWKDGRSAQRVMVGLSRGRKASVEIGRDLFAIHDSDRVGKLGVQRGEPVDRVHRKLARWVEVSDLTECVHSGVCPSRTMDPNRLLGDFSKGRFQSFLNGFPVWLDLPTGERTSVVGDSELQAHARSSTNSAPMKRRVSEHLYPKQ